MDLHEYPRPANDTGIGVHWTVGFASAIGLGRIRDVWIPELKALGVKWVKIFNHDGAIDFAELLLAEGLMPVVRIFRPSPNPSTLDVRDVVHLDSFIRAGVRYFEFNSEPDRDSEWKGGRVPANGLDLVVDNTIANLETILERGGMPGIPAVSNGSRWDLVGRIVAKGRKDLFNGPVWQAVHNYARNRPLDYPYDIGNQEGAAFSQRFYEAVAASDWGEDAWRGRSLSDVNRLRVDRANPGATIMDDNACWLAYEYCDARNRKHLGHSIPILSTESGHLIGEDIDPRYPATTPDLHMAQTLEACRVMMGSSTRFEAAPDYYFCTAFWLLGNAVLGSTSKWCERHAWYSDRSGGMTLPVVSALKTEPKKVRRWQAQASEQANLDTRTLLHGTVRHAGDLRALLLEKNGQEVARATLDDNSRYQIPDVPAGHYTLRVEGSNFEQAINLPPEQERVQVNLDLGQGEPTVGGSTILGRVHGGAGAVVHLLRASDGEDWVTLVKDDGTFRFVELGAGIYTLSVQSDGNTDLNQGNPASSPEAQVELDGENQAQVELVLPGWGYTIRQDASPGRDHRIRCRVVNRPGVQVQVQINEWHSAPVHTGDTPELGPDVCEIGGLQPGYYTLTVTDVNPATATGTAGDGAAGNGAAGDGGPLHLQAFVELERNCQTFVEFVHNQPQPRPRGPGQASSIRGRVVGGCRPDKRLYVWLIDQQANRREQQVNEDCTFGFDGLGPGRYVVEVAGYADDARRTDIALDGRNTVHVELFVPVEDDPTAAPAAAGSGSVIAGRLPERTAQATGAHARLVDSVGNEIAQVLEPDLTCRFEGLPAGVYSLSIEGGFHQADLTVDGSNGLEVRFQPLEMSWEYKASPAGSMPGYSVVRVEVEGMRGLPVYIWKEDWEGMMRRTGSKPEYGECSAEFSPLGPGIYMVEPEGLDVYADVELTGLEVIWIDFRRRAVPVSPHQVLPLDLGEQSPPQPAAPASPSWDLTSGDATRRTSAGMEDASGWATGWPTRTDFGQEPPAQDEQVPGGWTDSGWADSGSTDSGPTDDAPASDEPLDDAWARFDWERDDSAQDDLPHDDWEGDWGTGGETDSLRAWTSDEPATDGPVTDSPGLDGAGRAAHADEDSLDEAARPADSSHAPIPDWSAGDWSTAAGSTGEWPTGDWSTRQSLPSQSPASQQDLAAQDPSHQAPLQQNAPQQDRPQQDPPQQNLNQPVASRSAPYLYLAEQVADFADQLALLRYVARHQPGVGQDVDAAAVADYVLIVAPSLPVPPSTASAADVDTSQDSAADANPENEWGADFADDYATDYADHAQQAAPDEAETTNPADAALRDFDWRPESRDLDDWDLSADADLANIWPDWESAGTASDAPAEAGTASDAPADAGDATGDAPNPGADAAGEDAAGEDAAGEDARDAYAGHAQESEVDHPRFRSYWSAAPNRYTRRSDDMQQGDDTDQSPTPSQADPSSDTPSDRPSTPATPETGSADVDAARDETRDDARQTRRGWYDPAEGNVDISDLGGSAFSDSAANRAGEDSTPADSTTGSHPGEGHPEESHSDESYSDESYSDASSRDPDATAPGGSGNEHAAGPAADLAANDAADDTPHAPDTDPSSSYFDQPDLEQSDLEQSDLEQSAPDPTDLSDTTQDSAADVASSDSHSHSGTEANRSTDAFGSTDGLDDLYAAWIAAAARAREAAQNTGALDSDTDNSGADNTGTGNSGADNTGTGNTGTGNTGTDYADTDGMNFDMDVVDSTEPDSTKPDSTEPESTKPDSTEPPAATSALPDSARPDSASPDMADENGGQVQEPESGNRAHRMPSDAGAMAAPDEALMAEIATLEARLRAAGVPFVRLSGSFAHTLENY